MRVRASSSLDQNQIGRPPADSGRPRNTAYGSFQASKDGTSTETDRRSSGSPVGNGVPSPRRPPSGPENSSFPSRPQCRWLPQPSKQTSRHRSPPTISQGQSKPYASHSSSNCKHLSQHRRDAPKRILQLLNRRHSACCGKVPNANALTPSPARRARRCHECRRRQARRHKSGGRHRRVGLQGRRHSPLAVHGPEATRRLQ